MNRIEVFHLEGALINNYFEETNVKLVFFSTFLKKEFVAQCSKINTVYLRKGSLKKNEK